MHGPIRPNFHRYPTQHLNSNGQPNIPPENIKSINQPDQSDQPIQPFDKMPTVEPAPNSPTSEDISQLQ